MTKKSAITVNGLIPTLFTQMDDVIESQLSKEGKPRFPVFAWKMIGKEATEAVRSELDMNVFELIAKGWCTARELHKYSDHAKHPPRERSVVFLGEHDLKVEIHPEIVVTVGTVKFPPIRLTLELRANVRTAALTIQNGQIKSLGAGDCFATAQLKFEETALHDELESRHITFPGQLNFQPPGLEIQ